MELESGLLLGAIASLTTALVYLYRKAERDNDIVKQDLEACLERERARFTKGQINDESE